MEGGWQRFALLGANCVRLSAAAVRVADPAEPLNGERKDLQEANPIRVIKEDPRTRVPAAPGRRRVAEATRKLLRAAK